MKPRINLSLTLLSLPLLFATVAVGQDKPASQELPFPRDFDPARYLGTWYEVARLPTRIQPAETLAVAQYSMGKEEGLLLVKNSAYDQAGKKLSEIQGQARLAKGNPPGRLLVAFGPVLPDVPNYHVLHVDKDYQYAVVGVPDRQSLWILARKAPITDKALKSLSEIAGRSGFDVSKLILAPWDKLPKMPEAGPSPQP